MLKTIIQGLEQNSIKEPPNIVNQEKKLDIFIGLIKYWIYHYL